METGESNKGHSCSYYHPRTIHTLTTHNNMSTENKKRKTFTLWIISSFQFNFVYRGYYFCYTFISSILGNKWNYCSDCYKVFIYGKMTRIFSNNLISGFIKIIRIRISATYINPRTLIMFLYVNTHHSSI